MNYGSLRHYLIRRYLKAPDGDGAGGGGAPSGSDSGTPAPSGDVGGGSSVPASTPDGGGSPPSPSPDSNSDPWAALGEVDLDHIEVPQPTVPPVVPPAPQTPPVQPQTPPVAPQAPVTPPQPGQPQPQTPPTPAEPPQVELSPSDPAGMAAAMETNAPVLIQHLAQTRFQLTPEEVQELETDVTIAVPKLLARVHLESHIAMQKFLAQAVPGMIQRHTQVSSANSEAENKFFETHKATLGLDKGNAQHRQAAVRIAKMYRQMYPQAPLDQLIQDIGPMVAKAVGATPGAPTPQGQTQSGTVMVGQTAFRPAVNGSGAPIPSSAPQSDNEWAGMGATYD